MVLTWQFLMLAATSALSMLAAWHFARVARRTADALSEADRAAFEARYRDPAGRAGMPERFKALAKATDRARGGRAGVVMVAVVAVVVLIF